MIRCTLNVILFQNVSEYTVNIRSGQLDSAIKVHWMLGVQHDSMDSQHPTQAAPATGSFSDAHISFIGRLDASLVTLWSRSYIRYCYL